MRGGLRNAPVGSSQDMESSATATCPATRPCSAELDKLRDWHLRDALRAIARDPRPPLASHKIRLGKQTRCVVHEGRRWWVWESDKYIAYVRPHHQVELDRPEDVSVKDACEAYLWDMGFLDRDITRAEHARWMKVGTELAEPVIEQFRGLSDADLKRFVLDYCDGQIFCDHQVESQSDVGMVFMPLILGAFSTDPRDGEEPSEAHLQRMKLPEHPGGEPKTPLAPRLPDPPMYPDKPAPPVFVIEDEDYVRDLVFQSEDMGDITKVDDLFATVSGDESQRVLDYQESIVQKNVTIRADHDAVIAAWEAAKSKIDDAHEQALLDHQDALVQWQASVDGFEDTRAEWKRLLAIHRAASEGFTLTRMQNLGVIYEENRKAGPRSINGYPIFYSFRVLSRSDWDRARKVITRELERRDSMEI